MMSPPVIHMKMAHIRSGAAPSPETVRQGWNCEFNNHTGTPNQTDSLVGSHTPMCAAGLAARKGHTSAASRKASGASNCVMLSHQHNVRLEYETSSLPCAPCNVKFTVSADTPAANSSIPYLAIGFKGAYQSYFEAGASAFGVAVPDQPDYWGMSITDAEANLTNQIFKVADINVSGHLLVAYAHESKASCVRHMTADAYVGSVADTADDGVIQNASVRREKGRTIIDFTVSMLAAITETDLDWHANNVFGLLRPMWAIGTVGTDGGCAAPIGFHGDARSVTSLAFPLGRWECDAEVNNVKLSSGSPPMLDTDFIISV